MTTPRFPHKCPACSFVGIVQVNGYSFDVYRCSGGQSVIFRWGLEAAETLSCFVTDFPLEPLKTHRQVGEEGPARTIFNKAWVQIREDW